MSLMRRGLDTGRGERGMCAETWTCGGIVNRDGRTRVQWGQDGQSVSGWRAEKMQKRLLQSSLRSFFVMM